MLTINVLKDLTVNKAITKFFPLNVLTKINSFHNL